MWTYLEYMPLDIFHFCTCTSRLGRSRIKVAMPFFQDKVQILERFPLHDDLLDQLP